MKICFLASGSSIHSYRWIKYFADKGHDVYWVSLVPSGFRHIENVDFHKGKSFSIKALSVVAATTKIRKLLRGIKPDIVHAHYSGSYGLIGALSGYHPFVVTAWGSDVLITARFSLKKAAVRYALNSADVVTCDADHMREEMIRLGIAPGRIRIVYFGTDVEQFCPERRKVALRAELAVGDSPLIISLRSLEPVYDVRSLIEAAPLVLKEFTNAKFVVAGSGSEKERLKMLAGSLGVTESVVFVGQIPNDELPVYLASSDVYVSTSLSDAGLAASTAEAMACGLPVVVTDSGENRLWVEDSQNGYVVRVRDPAMLAERILCLLRDRELRMEFGQRGRQIIESRNSYAAEMAKMERIYQQVLTGGRIA